MSKARKDTLGLEVRHFVQPRFVASPAETRQHARGDIAPTSVQEGNTMEDQSVSTDRPSVLALLC